jgi:serine kinase of HPr protein (carbohydrate metabolism regulator)
LVAQPPETLAGLIELRGQGILRMPYRPSVVLALVVDLLPAADIERLPEPAALQVEIAGVRLARIALDQAQPAAPSVVRSVLTSRLNLLPSGPQTA